MTLEQNQESNQPNFEPGTPEFVFWERPSIFGSDRYRYNVVREEDKFDFKRVYVNYKKFGEDKTEVYYGERIVLFYDPEKDFAVMYAQNPRTSHNLKFEQVKTLVLADELLAIEGIPCESTLGRPERK